MFDKEFSFTEVFKDNGKQGIVGLCKDSNEKQNIFKFSQTISHLIRHEYSIMSGLKEISTFCPHFCTPERIISKNVEPKFKKVKNPFEISSKKPIKKDILIMKYINDSKKFYDFIKDKDIHEDVLYSIIKQVLLAINIAQKTKEFTHYDLHSDNIMIKKCNENDSILYVIDEDNKFLVHTHGYYPVIIDFGFSYIQDMENKPMWTTLAHTDIGFCSTNFDPVADPKLFLVTVSGEIKEKRGSINSKKLRRIVKNLFYNLNIDWDSGWDQDYDISISDYLCDKLEDYDYNTR
jgi:hypothetical protein